jgi:rhamnosyltransferase
MSLPGKPNLCAVLTSYNPDLNFEERVLHILKQVKGIAIVDNNSDSHVIVLLKELSQRNNIHIIFNKVNLGVATALNQGIRWAKENSYEWVILFDQDTTISDNLIETLCRTYQRIGTIEQVGIIGADYNNLGTEVIHDETKTDDSCYHEVKSIITSGSLFSIDLFDKIGPFRDDLFIDFIDIEYCLRARRKGYKILQLDASLMQHKIGSATMHKLLWKNTITSNHSPLRRYFMMRNHIIVVKKYFFIYPGWAFASLFERLISTVKMCLFESERIPKLINSTLGFIDGITGKCNRIIK